MNPLFPRAKRALQASAIVISLATALAGCGGDSDPASGSAVAQNMAAAGQNFTVTDLGTLPGKSASSAYGINDRGQVVGESYNEFGRKRERRGSRAFIYEDGVMTDLGALPGDSISVATGINDRGQVVGNSYSSAASGIHERAFLYEDGAMIDIGLDEANGINAHGQVAGASNGHASLYADGVITDLGTCVFRRT